MINQLKELANSLEAQHDEAKLKYEQTNNATFLGEAAGLMTACAAVWVLINKLKTWIMTPEELKEAALELGITVEQLLALRGLAIDLTNLN